MSRGILFAVLCSLELLIASVRSEELEPDVPEIWREDRIQSTTGALRNKITEFEDQAVKLLSNPLVVAKRPKTVFYVIRLLRDIRSVKAVGVLCELLLYEQSEKLYEDPIGDRLRRPATEALVYIGEPAVAGLLNRIASTQTNQEYRRVAIDVLQEIGGTEGALKKIDECQKDFERMNETTKAERLLGLAGEFQKRWKK